MLKIITYLATATPYSQVQYRGKKRYELSNHLGNVPVSGSDKRIPVCDEEYAVAYFKAEVMCAQDYYPFGMVMPERQYQSDTGYRYGFNGMEKDNETYGESSGYDFGARIYDSRLGRWLSVDPLMRVQPYSSSYKSFANNPISYIDPDGRLEFEVVKLINKKTGQEIILYYLKSYNVMTDGVPHSYTQLGNTTSDTYRYYDYISKTTTIIYNEDGTVTTTTSNANTILYDNGYNNECNCADEEYSFYPFSYAKKGEVKVKRSLSGTRQQWQTNGLRITYNSPGAGVSQTKYYTKSQVKNLKLDEIIGTLRYGLTADKLKNIFDRAKKIDDGTESIESIRKILSPTTNNVEEKGTIESDTTIDIERKIKLNHNAEVVIPDKLTIPKDSVESVRKKYPEPSKK